MKRTAAGASSSAGRRIDGSVAVATRDVRPAPAPAAASMHKSARRPTKTIMMRLFLGSSKNKGAAVLRWILCLAFLYVYLTLIHTYDANYYDIDTDSSKSNAAELQLATTNGTRVSSPLFSRHETNQLLQEEAETNAESTTKPKPKPKPKPILNTQNTTTSACLMVMDDNHFLVEWIAYHYHAANLRRLVIAVDPKSLTSPLEILGRWKDKIDLTVWIRDDDYINRLQPDEFEKAQTWVRREFRETTPLLVEHRARQRLFYTHCLRRLKRDSERSRSKSRSSSSSAWTMLVDVDEFVRVHHRVADSYALPESLPPASEPGSVATLLETLADPLRESASASGERDGGTTTTPIPLRHLQSSPCVPLPRLRFAGDSNVHSSAGDDNDNDNDDNDDNDRLLTLRYRTHAGVADLKTNKISKTMVDLSRIPLQDIAVVNSIHVPIRKHCSLSNRHVLPTDSLLVANHYLGSYEQFTYRETDARNSPSSVSDADADADADADESAATTKVNVRNAQKYHDQNAKIRKSHPESDDEIASWLDGFLTGEDQDEKRFLLNGAGQLAPKSWQPFFDSNDTNNNNNNSNNNNDGEAGRKERCALLFFGLTRSYKDMVLPSLTRNVLEPNARHGCDVFAHFYTQETESRGRKNPGGYLRPRDIGLLKDAVQSVARAHYDRVLLGDHYGVLDEFSRPAYRPPVVAFAHDTPEAYQERRSEQMRKYREATTTVAGTTVLAYAPWKAKSYGPESVDNIVKQWHSIQTVFKLMDYTATVQKHSYTRVGMFRSDALYVTPIDIASLGSARNPEDESFEPSHRGKNRTRQAIDHSCDVHNRHFVTPAFAMYPVNDRMVYGPYDAVRVWATKRFDLLEESAALQTNPGWTMHSERFLNGSVIPAMEILGYEHVSRGDICFLRTRADESAVIGDCCMSGLVSTPRTSFWNDPDSREAEELQLTSVESIVGKRCSIRRLVNKKWRVVLCGENQNGENWQDES